jgi:surface antigen
VAAKFGITSDTIRWSNGIDGDTLQPGHVIVISPVSGLVYTVKAGDTPDSLAAKYKANAADIIAFNDAEIGGLKVGEQIVIPNGDATPAPVARFAATNLGNGFAFGSSALFTGSATNNGYDIGYCTWWAAYRRAQIGRPVPSNLGNASTWKVLAEQAGMAVGNKPEAGAVIWFPPTDWYGHVGFVESVNSDGSANISEMNVSGWDVVDHRTIPAAQVSAYSYIY